MERWTESLTDPLPGRSGKKKVSQDMVDSEMNLFRQAQAG